MVYRSAPHPDGIEIDRDFQQAFGGPLCVGAVSEQPLGISYRQDREGPWRSLRADRGLERVGAVGVAVHRDQHDADLPRDLVEARLGAVILAIQKVLRTGTL